MQSETSGKQPMRRRPGRVLKVARPCQWRGLSRGAARRRLWAVWVLASGALLLAILLFWWSLLALTAHPKLTLDQALSLAAPTAEDEQKRALLRALKDLEYELQVGKISAADYRQLSSVYRTRATVLLRQMDRNLGPMRERAEQLLNDRLASEPVGQEQALGPSHHNDLTDTTGSGGSPTGEQP